PRASRPLGQPWVRVVGTSECGVVPPQARSITGRDVSVEGPGGWGPWVDGGAWLDVGGTAVDWIIRDVDRVRRQRERAVRGEFASP
ncbi:MAG: hypothetical protein M0Z51_17980, partial [Propionibacterium sp.]|nr:hypothetical protein [Propionibacterium sp.]